MKIKRSELKARKAKDGKKKSNACFKREKFLA
jgi:hypothetical protein